MNTVFLRQATTFKQFWTLISYCHVFTKSRYTRQTSSANGIIHSFTDSFHECFWHTQVAWPWAGAPGPAPNGFRRSCQGRTFTREGRKFLAAQYLKHDLQVMSHLCLEQIRGGGCRCWQQVGNGLAVSQASVLVRVFPNLSCWVLTEPFNFSLILPNLSSSFKYFFCSVCDAYHLDIVGTSTSMLHIIQPFFILSCRLLDGSTWLNCSCTHPVIYLFSFAPV